MRIGKTLLLSVAGTALIASSAIAADPVVFEAIPMAVGAAPLPAPGCDTAGYVDSYLGAGKGHYFFPDNDENAYRWRELAFGGAGRAAIQCSPAFSIQLDAWADHWSGQLQTYLTGEPSGEPSHFDRTTMGIGTHLTYDGGSFLAGVLVSIGSVAGSGGSDDWWGTFANIALEAAFNTPNLGVQGQIGHTRALFGNAADVSASDWYAHAVAAFYPNPNMSVSANLGFDSYSDTYEWYRRGLNWGAKFELKPQSLPVSFYVAYQGWHWGGDYDTDTGYDYVYGSEHTIRLGVRFLVGAATLRELDEAVGLADHNAIYGAAFGPTYLYDH